MYIPRTIEKAFLKASEQFPVTLVTGPRQVGKTTLLQHLCEKKRRYLTLDDLSLRALANDDPALFMQRFTPPLLIDEIQYAPRLLPYIKMAVDAAKKAGAFWLTGSQQFHLMQGITESLAGRVAIINLLGLSCRERDRRGAKQPFLPTRDRLASMRENPGATSLPEVFQAIWLGSFPALHSGQIQDRDLFYSAYLQTYLARDVHDLAQVGNRDAFLRFLKACAARSAQLLNLSDLARDADVSPVTAKSWLAILRASLQVVLLEPYHSNITKRLVKRPKLYFLDTGLCAYLAEWSSPETLAAGAMRGAILETHVMSEILKSWWHHMQTPSLYYYRDKDKKEIDFLFVQDGKLYPVEVKLGATVSMDWRRNFSVLGNLHMPVGSGGVVCLCGEWLPIGEGLSAIPVGLL